MPPTEILFPDVPPPQYISERDCVSFPARVDGRAGRFVDGNGFAGQQRFIDGGPVALEDRAIDGEIDQLANGHSCIYPHRLFYGDLQCPVAAKSYVSLAGGGVNIDA